MDGRRWSGRKGEKEWLKDPKNAIREFVWKAAVTDYTGGITSFKVLARLFLKYSSNIARLWGSTGNGGGIYQATL
jgi:predicted aminopeptidase